MERVKNCAGTREQELTNARFEKRRHRLSFFFDEPRDLNAENFGQRDNLKVQNSSNTDLDLSDSSPIDIHP